MNADRIAKIYLGGSFGVVEWAPNSFGPEGPALAGLLPEVDNHSLSRNTNGVVRVGDNLFSGKCIPDPAKRQPG